MGKTLRNIVLGTIFTVGAFLNWGCNGVKAKSDPFKDYKAGTISTLEDYNSNIDNLAKTQKGNMLEHASGELGEIADKDRADQDNRDTSLGRVKKAKDDYDTAWNKDEDRRKKDEDRRRKERKAKRDKLLGKSPKQDSTKKDKEDKSEQGAGAATTQGKGPFGYDWGLGLKGISYDSLSRGEFDAGGLSTMGFEFDYYLDRNGFLYLDAGWSNDIKNANDEEGSWKAKSSTDLTRIIIGGGCKLVDGPNMDLNLRGGFGKVWQEGETDVTIASPSDQYTTKFSNYFNVAEIGLEAPINLGGSFELVPEVAYVRAFGASGDNEMNVPDGMKYCLTLRYRWGKKE